MDKKVKDEGIGDGVDYIITEIIQNIKFCYHCGYIYVYR